MSSKHMELAPVSISRCLLVSVAARCVIVRNQADSRAPPCHRGKVSGRHCLIIKAMKRTNLPVSTLH